MLTLPDVLVSPARVEEPAPRVPDTGTVSVTLNKIERFNKEKDGGVTKLVFETTEPWVRHSFRARTVARGTGYPLDKPIGPSGEIPDQTVLVFAGDYPDDPIDWKTFAAKLGHKDPDAELAGKSAQITVTFVSELISAVRNAAREVISGDPKRIKEVTDVWTFARDVTASNPNWHLVATRAAH